MKKKGNSLPAAERRALTVQAVLQLAACQNPADITTEAIAARMGLTQAALFRHFPTKDMLWQEMMQWATTELFTAVEHAAATATTPLDALERIYRTHLAFVVKHPGVPRVLFAELQNPTGSEARTIVRSMLMRYSALLENIMIEGMAQNQIHPATDARAAAALFIGSLQGQVIQSMITGDSTALPEHGAKPFQLIRRALECRPT